MLPSLFQVSARPWPYAALTRGLDAGDAREGVWIRADPVHLSVDSGAVRLLAAGTLGLEQAQCSALLRSLAPLLGDAGLQLSVAHPERWYLRAQAGTTLPDFTAPWCALGEDLRPHLPKGPDAARWHRLLNESQMLLHQHPVNLARAAAGKPAANSLWFWGAGAWPARVGTRLSAVASEDSLLLAMAKAAGIAHGLTLAGHTVGCAALDLRAAREPVALDRDWIEPAERAVRSGQVRSLEVIFADGASVQLSRAGAFSFWRRSRALE